MKKFTVFAAVALMISCAVFAGNKKNTLGQSSTSDAMQQGQAATDCSQLTTDEQNFATQLTDMNNKKAFCSQFTPQQRQQAMLMVGRPDASGKMMNADQAVQQTMMAPQAQTKPKGGCPVK